MKHIARREYFRLYLQAGRTIGIVGLGEMAGSPLAPQVALFAEEKRGPGEIPTEGIA